MSQLPRLEVSISFPDAPETEWQVSRLQLEEAINEAYLAQLVLECEDLDTSAHELLGATCELTLSRGERSSRVLFGVVARVDYRSAN